MIIQVKNYLGVKIDHCLVIGAEMVKWVIKIIEIENLDVWIGKKAWRGGFEPPGPFGQ